MQFHIALLQKLNINQNYSVPHYCFQYQQNRQDV